VRGVEADVASPVQWQWRQLTTGDVDWLVELKARAMRPDLERLGRWDPARSRRRLLDELVLDATRVVEVAGDPVASIALVPTPQTAWLQHFYVEPAAQGRGLGSAVLGRLLEAATGLLPIRLLAVRGSRSIRLYERHGFRHERDHENEVDVVLVREPRT
jgi:GNAT superfamily N-acetyltransferase